MKENKEERFRALFERFYQDVVDWYCRRGVDGELARDLAQDVFFRVFRGLDGFRGESPWPWILVIVKRLWSNKLRKSATQKRGNRETNVDAVPEPRPDNLAPWIPRRAPPDKRVQGKEWISRLNEVLRTLPKRSRQIFLMRYRDDLEILDIARIQSVSKDTVKGDLRSARARVREAFPDLLPEEPKNES